METNLANANMRIPNPSNTFLSITKYGPNGRITGTIGTDAVTLHMTDVHVYDVDLGLVIISIGHPDIRYFAPSSFYKTLKERRETQ